MFQEILDSDNQDKWTEYYFRLWQKAVEAAKLALADDERCFENTGHHNIQYETREALRAVVTENARQQNKQPGAPPPGSGPGERPLTNYIINRGE